MSDNAVARPAQQTLAPAITEIQEIALQLQRNGYSPLPIKKGTKRPPHQDWTKACDAADSERTICEYQRWLDARGLGVACGFGNENDGYLLAVDPDNVTREQNDAIEVVLERHGPLSPVGKTGQKGCTRFYRTRQPLFRRDGPQLQFRRPKTVGKGDEVMLDLLSHGRQTVVPPTVHPDTKLPYTWQDDGHTLLDVPLDELPWLPDTIADEMYAALRPWLTAAGQAGRTTPRPGLERQYADWRERRYSDKYGVPVSLDDILEAAPTLARYEELNAQGETYARDSQALIGLCGKIAHAYLRSEDLAPEALGKLLIHPTDGPDIARNICELVTAFLEDTATAPAAPMAEACYAREKSGGAPKVYYEVVGALNHIEASNPGADAVARLGKVISTKKKHTTIACESFSRDYAMWEDGLLEDAPDAEDYDLPAGTAPEPWEREVAARSLNTAGETARTRDRHAKHNAEADMTAKMELAFKPYAVKDPSTIPPREWVYGNMLIRRFVSGRLAPSKVGKTALGLTETLAMVTGRNLLGVEELVPLKPLRVLYWNGEDPQEEIERRFEATRLHFQCNADDIGDRLILLSGRNAEIKIAHTTRGTSGAEINVPLRDMLITLLKQHKVDVVYIDPFISSHAVDENSNVQIDAVVKTWAAIADECQCAIMLVHHLKKPNGAERTVDDGRGASAMNAALRNAHVLQKMTAEDASKLNIPADDAWRYFRITDSHASMSPPASASTWYRQESVTLGNAIRDDNGNELRRSDSVGVATSWTPPDVLEDVDASAVNAFIDEMVACGPNTQHESVLGSKWAGYILARHLALDVGTVEDKQKDLSEEQVRHRKHVQKHIKALTKEGVLTTSEDLDGNRVLRRYVSAKSTFRKAQKQ